jgi:GTP pyrophosphokinase
MNKFSNYQYQKDRFNKNIEQLSEKDREFVLKAYQEAESSHKGQERAEGVPYFIHCLRIANNLMEKLDVFKKEAIAAALLHDSVEDSEMELSHVQVLFGKEVAEMVDNLTRDHDGDTEENKYERKVKHAEHVSHKDRYSQMIKAMDFLDNVTSWSVIPLDSPLRKKFPRWFKEAENMYIPFAKKLDDKIADDIKEQLEVINQQDPQ